MVNILLVIYHCVSLEASGISSFIFNHKRHNTNTILNVGLLLVLWTVLLGRWNCFINSPLGLRHLSLNYVAFIYFLYIVLSLKKFATWLLHHIEVVIFIWLYIAEHLLIFLGCHNESINFSLFGATYLVGYAS